MALNASEHKATLTFSDSTAPIELPIYKGSHRPRRDRHSGAVLANRQVHLRPGFPVDRCVQFVDHIHRRRPRRAAVSGLSDRAAGHSLQLPGSLLPDPVRGVARFEAAQGIRRSGFAPHDGARADAVLHARVPARCPSDVGPDRPGRGDVGVLPRTRSTCTTPRNGRSPRSG